MANKKTDENTETPGPNAELLARLVAMEKQHAESIKSQNELIETLKTDLEKSKQATSALSSGSPERRATQKEIDDATAMHNAVRSFIEGKQIKMNNRPHLWEVEYTMSQKLDESARWRKQYLALNCDKNTEQASVVGEAAPRLGFMTAEYERFRSVKYLGKNEHYDKDAEDPIYRFTPTSAEDMAKAKSTESWTLPGDRKHPMNSVLLKKNATA